MSGVGGGGDRVCLKEEEGGRRTLSGCQCSDPVGDPPDDEAERCSCDVVRKPGWEPEELQPTLNCHSGIRSNNVLTALSEHL